MNWCVPAFPNRTAPDRKCPSRTQTAGGPAGSAGQQRASTAPQSRDPCPVEGRGSPRRASARVPMYSMAIVHLTVANAPAKNVAAQEPPARDRVVAADYKFLAHISGPIFSSLLPPPESRRSEADHGWLGQVYRSPKRHTVRLASDSLPWPWLAGRRTKRCTSLRVSSPTGRPRNQGRI